MVRTREQILLELAKPFPKHLIHTNPSGGGSYIKHHVVEQRLIQVFGKPPKLKMVEIIRGDVPGYTTKNNKTFPDLTNVIVGVVGRLSVDLDLDTGDELWEEEEAGDCEQPHNWTTDGQRLKDAMSDAYKRCAMRWGCALHLWSQDEYFLYEVLKRDSGSDAGSAPIQSAEPKGSEASRAEDVPSPTPPEVPAKAGA